MTSTWHTRKFRISRTKLRHGALLAGVLAVIGLWAMFLAGPALGEGRLIGGVNLLLAAGIGFHVLRSARNPTPLMVLDSDGIWLRDWGLGTVPWAQVSDAYLGGGRLQSFIYIEIRDGAALLAWVPKDAQRKLRSNRLVKPSQLLVPNGTLDAPLEDILAAIREGMARG